jgi:DNA polymerase-3 subunit delta'
MIIGHQKVIEDLKNLAEDKRLPHSCIFFGPPRVGKKLVALGLANYLENKNFDAGDKQIVLSDVLVVGPDENKTVGIDKVRGIKQFLWQTPNRSPYRTVIITDGEYLTAEAQNALLKITEEPPRSALIILVIDDPERLLPTVQSRFHKIYFSPVPVKLIKDWLVEELKCPALKAESAASKSFGEPGLAWRLLKDEQFQKLQSAAKRFLDMPRAGRKDFIKDMVAAEDFDFSGLLEAIMICLLPVDKRNIVFWRRLLVLRREANYFNLNPRLQLTALAESLG